MKTLRLYILILCSFLFACSERKKDEPSKVISQKDEMTLLNEQIQKSPNDAQLLYKRAEAFFQKNLNNQSLEDINKAIAIDSSKDVYYVLQANINFKELQIQKAMDAFKKAIELNPSNSDAHVKLAELYLYVKSYNASLSEANAALKIDKSLAKGYFIKGFAYKEMGDTLKALSSFQTAVEVKSDYYDAYIQLGNILSVRKDPVALQYYTNALHIRPSSTEAFYNRGLLLQNMNRLDAAISDYTNILRLDPAYADAHFNLGFIDMAYKGDTKSAMRHFTDAIRVNQDYVEAYYNRGLCYEETGDKESAIKDYQHALSIVPTFKLAKEKLRSMKR